MLAEWCWQRDRRGGRTWKETPAESQREGKSQTQNGTDAALASPSHKLSLQGFWRPWSTECNYSNKKSHTQPST